MLQFLILVNLIALACHMPFIIGKRCVGKLIIIIIIIIIILIVPYCNT
jgi:hypothetical protein